MIKTVELATKHKLKGFGDKFLIMPVLFVSFFTHIPVFDDFLRDEIHEFLHAVPCDAADFEVGHIFGKFAKFPAEFFFFLTV